MNDFKDTGREGRRTPKRQARSLRRWAIGMPQCSMCVTYPSRSIGLDRMAFDATGHRRDEDDGNVLDGAAVLGRTAEK